MWELETIIEKPNSIWKYRLKDDDESVSFQQVIRWWQFDSLFNQWFTERILDHPSAAIRWETPPLTHKIFERQFEFVVVDTPSLDRAANPTAFSRQFGSAEQGRVIAFPNLGKNAIMVVPTPSGRPSEYCHLLSFLRNSSREQTNQLWQVVGQQMEKRVGEKPVWLSTAGGGVPWLHVRLDDRPKYYSYRLYREEKVANE